LGARGHLDFQASKEALAELAWACRKRGVDRALLDLRELPIPPKPIFKPAELAALVETFHQAGFTRKHRLAVLYRSDPHHGARCFAFIGTLRGWKVRAFEEFEKALFWLSEEEREKRSAIEQHVPIKVVNANPEREGRPGRPTRQAISID